MALRQKLLSLSCLLSFVFILVLALSIKMLCKYPRKELNFLFGQNPK